MTPRQYEFVDQYLKCFSIAKAARLAGLPVPYGYELMKRKDVRKHLSNRKRSIAKQHTLEIEHFQKQLFALVTRDVRSYYDPTIGRVLRPEDLSELAALAVESVRECTKTDNQGNTTTTFEYKFSPKIAALELFAKHAGLLAPEKHEHNVTGKVQIDYEKLYQPKQTTLIVDPVNYALQNVDSPEMPKIEQQAEEGPDGTYDLEELMDLPDDGE